MSVKTTKYLTRAEVVHKLLLLLPALPDDTLADLLERANDAACGGECFENYLIVADWQRRDPTLL